MPTAHFELQVADTDAGKAFYRAVFGWDFERFPDADYHLVLGDGIGRGQPVSGALMPRNGPLPVAGTAPRGAVVTFPVDNVDAAYSIALDSGGAEAMAPEDFPGVGRLAYIEDGHGNIVGMITPPKETT